MTLPAYPNFAPVSLGLQEEIQKIVLDSKSDISALTFANLYLFRNKYEFNVSLLNNSLLVAGKDNLSPCAWQSQCRRGGGRKRESGA